MKASVQATIRSSIEECDKHHKKIRLDLGRLEKEFPLSTELLENLSEESEAYLDQFLFRFTKMQDSMGTRLIPSAYAYLEVDDNPRPFLDILRKLEKLGVLTSEDDWIMFRNLRNSIAHDYPETKKQTVEALNLLFEEMEKFLSLYVSLRDSVQARIKKEK